MSKVYVVGPYVNGDAGAVFDMLKRTVDVLVSVSVPDADADAEGRGGVPC